MVDDDGDVYVFKYAWWQGQLFMFQSDRLSGFAVMNTAHDLQDF